MFLALSLSLFSALFPYNASRFASRVQDPVVVHQQEEVVVSSAGQQELSVPVRVSQPSAGSPNNNNIVINNYNNCNPNTVNSNQAQAHNYTAIHLEQLQQIWQNIDINACVHTAQRVLDEYKYYIGGAAIGLLYGGICYHMYKAKQYIAYRTVWSSWHKELSMEELLAMDIHKLSKELILAIHMRHSNDQHPVDFLSPLIAFNIHIKKELHMLQFYKQLYAYCNAWYITKLTPFSPVLLEELKEHIERALYVHSVFKNWAAHHTIAQHELTH